MRDELAKHARPERTHTKWYRNVVRVKYRSESPLEFNGAYTPDIRCVAKMYSKSVPFADLEVLMSSVVFEERLLALYTLIQKYKEYPQEVFDFYVQHFRYLEGWALVDASAYQIVGEHLKDRDRSFLFKLTGSLRWWERRIAIVATFNWIRQGDFEDTLRLSKIYWTDEHDLIQKATGWMLREVGKYDFATLEAFCRENPKMPKFVKKQLLPTFSSLRTYVS